MSARRRENPTLMAALQLAAQGFRVFPLAPGRKTPAIATHRGGHGHNDATRDEGQIREWWDGQGRARGIGIRPDDDVLVLDLDVHGDPAAQEIVDRLTALLPATRTHLTGAGGGNRHLFYRFEPGSTVSGLRNTARVLPHIDVRTSAGYVVAPPTAHEVTGAPYVVDDSAPSEIATLTDEAWSAVVALARELKPEATPDDDMLYGESEAAKDSPVGPVSATDAARWLNARTSPAYVTDASFYDDDVAETIEPFVTAGEITGNSGLAKPVKRLVCLAAEGATGAVEALNDLRSLWLASPHRSGDPAFEWDHTVRRMIAAYGDLGSVDADADADAVEDGDNTVLNLFADVAALLAEGVPEPPVPTVLTCNDGVSLLYPAKTNLLFGDPESGKTWVGLAALASVLVGGGKAAFIDLDHNGLSETVARLAQLGVADQILASKDRFLYGEPEDKLTLRRMVKGLKAWGPDAVLIDSLGELIPLFGGDSNSADDFTGVNREVFSPLARAGAAVIVIDHLAKNPDSRRQGPTGTAAKSRAISGVSMRVSIVEPFAPARGGACLLRIAKDRPGGLRRHRPADKGREARAAIFSMAVDGSFVVRAPVVETKTSDESLEADVKKLLEWVDPPKSAYDIKYRLRPCGSDRAARLWRRYLQLAEPEGFQLGGKEMNDD